MKIKMTILVTVILVLTGCSRALYDVQVQRILISEATDGTKWEIMKLNSLSGGKVLAGQNCDEGYYVQTNADGVVLELKPVNPKICGLEQSVRNAVLGHVIDPLIAAGGIIGFGALVRPPEYHNTESINVSGGSSEAEGGNIEPGAFNIDTNAYGGNAEAEAGALAVSNVKQTNITQKTPVYKPPHKKPPPKCKHPSCRKPKGGQRWK